MCEAASRILVIRAGALGDFVLTLPLIECVRKHFPDAMITLAGYRDIAILALEAGLADEIVRVDDALFAPLFSEGPSATEELRAFAARFDRGIVVWHDASRRIAQGLRVAGLDDVLHIDPIPAEGDAVHSISHMLSQLPKAWGSDWAEPLHCPASAARRSDMRERFGNCAVVHPGSGGRGADRNWPAERFAQVCDTLAAAGMPCVIPQGPADEQAVADTLASCVDAEPRVAVDLSVPELAALLAEARVCVGNDSGVTHLAAAVGTRTVAVFGATDSVVWRPSGRDVRLLRAVPITDISVGEVLREAGVGD